MPPALAMDHTLTSVVLLEGEFNLSLGSAVQNPARAPVQNLAPGSIGSSGQMRGSGSRWGVRHDMVGRLNRDVGRAPWLASVSRPAPSLAHGAGRLPSNRTDAGP